MARKKSDCECGPGGVPPRCCSVEAIVSIDGRGQIVLPKEVRDKAGIEAGDKLTVVTCGDGAEIGMIALIRSSDFGRMVSDFMNPMMGGAPQK